MSKHEFILAMERLGFTDFFIGEVLELSEQGAAAGMQRGWEEYLPEWYVEKKRNPPYWAGKQKGGPASCTGP